MMVYLMADDLTGANDTVVRFAEAGARAITVFNIDQFQNNLDYQALAFALGSRNLAPESAYQVNRALAKKLPVTREDLIYKKIDSALRGNIGAEIEGILDGLSDEKIALVAPAFPENHRIMVGGYQLIHEIPVHESEMANDPITPVTCSHLPTVLTRDCRRKVGWLSLGEVTMGVTAVEQSLKQLIDDGCQIIVADATQIRHLEILASVISNRKEAFLPCGTAGLAGAVARRLFRNYHVGEKFLSGNKGILVAVIGSKSPVSRLQIKRALEAIAWVGEVTVNSRALCSQKERETEIQRTVSAVSQLIATGKKGIIIHLRDEPSLGVNLDASALASGLGVITFNLTEVIETQVLYLSGGDIAVSVATALEGWGIEIKAQLEPGICIGSLLRKNYPKLNMVSKAGSFGDEETLARVFKILFDK